jgi:SNF2 family DNA or RNA helicase
LAFNVLLTTYELVMKDKQRLKRFHYKYIVIDEGHRMKNAASKLSATLMQYEAQHRILLTGTPLQNSLHELWALLNFLLPKIFASSDTFEQWFSAPLAAAGANSSAEDLAMSEEESLLVINRLHQVVTTILAARVSLAVQPPGGSPFLGTRV